MSAKGDCGKHGHGHGRKKLFRRLAIAAGVFVLLVLLAILIIWLVLRPTKPRFSLQDATIYQLSSNSSTFSATLQVSLSSTNPNTRIGVDYDRLRAYASYRDQQITLPTELPASYLGHDDVIVWSPLFYGSAVPVAPYLSSALSQDKAAGFVLLSVKVDGRLRWKVGTWISGHYNIDVSCPAYAYAAAAPSSGSQLRLRHPIACSTDI